MRPGDDSQRTVVLATFVQVQTDRDQLGHHRCWRLHVVNALLYRPRAEVWDIFSHSNRNGFVLVPNYFPIGVGGLVEQDAANDKAFLPEYGGSELLDRFRYRQFAHHWNV